MKPVEIVLRREGGGKRENDRRCKSRICPKHICKYHMYKYYMLIKKGRKLRPRLNPNANPGL
jgi:hypothetical protein